MTAAAAATTTLRIGTHTLGNDYRHPAVLAKELATIDQLSGGRVEVGIGAGWFRADYDALGIPMESAGIRIERLAEAVEIFTRACAGERFSFAGRHYQLSDFELSPLPRQRPHPPIMIGGGRPRILSLAARMADVVGLNFSLHLGSLDRGDGSSGTREATRAQIDLIRDVAGDRFEQIELCMGVHHVANRSGADASVAALASVQGLTPQQVRECPHFLFGETAELIEQLERLREEFGVSYIAIPCEAVTLMEPVVAQLSGR
jgi:probable F420-dependent oxidoreductase